MGSGRRHVLAIDSGIGGLGIVAALRRAVPGVAVTFVADHAFYPYGRRSDAELIGRMVEIVGQTLDAYAPELVVIACNTASTIALDALRARFAVPFVGTVPPVKWAASLSRSRTIGLLATEATVGRAYVRDLRERYAPDCRLVAYGARELADAAEAQFVGQAVSTATISREVGRLFASEGGAAIDVVCLGCTHYGLLLPSLLRSGPDVAWLDPADAVARRAAAVLGGLTSRPHAAAFDRALVTAEPAPAFRAGLAGFGFDRVDVPVWSPCQVGPSIPSTNSKANPAAWPS